MGFWLREWHKMVTAHWALKLLDLLIVSTSSKNLAIPGILMSNVSKNYRLKSRRSIVQRCSKCPCQNWAASPIIPASGPEKPSSEWKGLSNPAVQGWNMIEVEKPKNSVVSSFTFVWPMLVRIISLKFCPKGPDVRIANKAWEGAYPQPLGGINSGWPVVPSQTCSFVWTNAPRMPAKSIEVLYAE